MVELKGNYVFNAPQDLVWEMLLDPSVLARIMPGCEKLEQTGENVFEGKLNIRIGPVQGVFQGTVELSDLRPPHGYHMLVNGRGPAGIVRGEGDLQLAPAESGTNLSYQGEAQVSGRIASVGQRLMDSSAKAIVSQSLQNLEKQIQARMQPEPEVEGETAVATPFSSGSIGMPSYVRWVSFSSGLPFSEATVAAIHSSTEGGVNSAKSDVSVCGSSNMDHLSLCSGSVHLAAESTHYCTGSPPDAKNYR